MMFLFLFLIFGESPPSMPPIKGKALRAAGTGAPTKNHLSADGKIGTSH